MELRREDRRTVMYYCWKRGLSAASMAEEMCATLGEGTVTERTCLNWIKKFDAGNFSLADEPRIGRPSSTHIDDEIEACLKEDKHATTRDIAEIINVSHDTVWRHLHTMEKQYLMNRWVPHKLTEENKCNRVRIASELLASFGRNNFLNRTITVDETWIYWDNQGFGGRKRSWRGSGDGPVFVPKRSNMTTRKHLLTVFWDAKGILLLDTLPRNVSMDSVYYCTLLDRLKIAVQSERRRLIDENGLHDVHFLHDNARPHVAARTMEKLRDIGFTVLPHPPYSPDIAPSDFYLFSPMKSALKGKNFDSAAEIQDTLNGWFASKSRVFFQKAFLELPNRWQKVIDSNGDYFD